MVLEKTAIVTGGAKRVGKAISLSLAQNGYNVIVIYNSSSDAAKEVKSDIEKQGRKAYLYQADFNDFASASKIFDKIFSEHKNVQLLVNNASVFEKHSFAETSEQVFDSNINVNFKIPFFAIQKYSSYCKAQGFIGHTVNINDSYAYKHQSPYFAYLLSKKALYELTLMAAIEVGINTRVNSVAIGLLLTSEDWPLEKMEKVAEKLPLKRVATLDEITGAINYLDKNQYINGEVLSVDGGIKLINN